MTGIEASLEVKEELRKTNRFLSKLSFVLLFLVVLSISLNFVQWKYQPEPKLLGITTENRVLPLPFLDEPFFSTSAVLSWVEKRIEESFTFSFVDYKQMPTRLAVFMPEPVVESHIKGLQASGLWHQVISEVRVATAIKDKPPVLLKSGISNGRFLWHVEMPIKITMENAENRKIVTRVVRVLVGRESLNKTPDGLIIGKVTAYE